MLVHTDDKPYKCNECGKSYSCSSFCKTHCKKHTVSRLKQAKNESPTLAPKSVLKREAKLTCSKDLDLLKIGVPFASYVYEIVNLFVRQLHEILMRILVMEVLIRE